MKQDLTAAAEEHSLEIECIWPGQATLGECPIWDDRRQCLFWIDSLEKIIWRSDVAGAGAQAYKLPDLIGSIGLCEDGRFISGLAGGFALIDISSDPVGVEWIGNPEPEKADTRLNDGKVDRQGRFWCGTMNQDFATPNASLYRLDPELAWHRLDTGFTVSNGIAFSIDGKTIYFSDSRVDRSYQYTLDPMTGALSDCRSFVETTAYEGRIDGATVDADGNYWGALFDGSAVGCFSPDGKMIRHVRLPVTCPTMCAFGGPQMDVLFVTSARFSMSEAQIAAETSAGGLFAIRGLGVRGIPEPRFDAT